MKFLKKNQVVIYVIALMLVVAGYLNFSTNGDFKTAVQTASSEEELEKMANIGDAQLVSSNVVSEENSTENVINNKVSTNVENTVVQETDNKVENNTKEDNKTVETSSDTQQKDNGKNDYFKTSKLERDTMYSQMLETYGNILNSNNSLETQKQSATEEIKKINDTKNSIMICENLIMTKGFENVVIFVNGDSISVVVKDDNLNTEKVAQIQNIISRELKSKVEITNDLLSIFLIKILPF